MTVQLKETFVDFWELYADNAGCWKVRVKDELDVVIDL